MDTFFKVTTGLLTGLIGGVMLTGALFFSEEKFRDMMNDMADDLDN